VQPEKLQPIFNFVKNPVRWEPSKERDLFTVSGTGNLRGVLAGLGFLYFYEAEDGGLSSEFSFLQSYPAGYSMIEPQVFTMGLDSSTRVPCSCIIPPDHEGAFIIAPALYLDAPNSQDMVLMLVSPTAPTRELSIDKTTLQIPGEEATVTLFTGEGELRCRGSVSGRGVKSAKLVLSRNPGCPVFPAGYEETLCELRGEGMVFAIWKPVVRSFEECLIVFPPSKDFSLDQVAEHLGAPDIDFTETMKSYVVADGVGVNYKVRLVLERSMGRSSSDEATVTVT
jgi:hypothetical protein